MRETNAVKMMSVSLFARRLFHQFIDDGGEFFVGYKTLALCFFLETSWERDRFTLRSACCSSSY